MTKLVCALLAASLLPLSLFATPPSGRYLEIVHRMKVLEKTYPAYASVYSIGQNDDGVDILALRVSTTPSIVDEGKVGQVLVATHHGNEGAAATFALHFTERLLQRYAREDLSQGSLSRTEWTIIPVLNIPGYNANQREEHSIDPNRDYPGICTASFGRTLKSVRLMMKVLESRHFAGSVTVHGFSGTLTYPWGVDADDTRTPDQDLFEKVVARAASLNGYHYGTSTDLVYPADGAYEDYAYWKYGLWSLLVELKDGSETDITSTTKAIRSYFENLSGRASPRHDFTGHCNNIAKATTPSLAQTTTSH